MVANSRASHDTWIQRCRQNIKRFKADRQQMSTEEQIQFIRSQYEILAVLVKVVDGKVRIRGSSYFTQRGNTV